MNNNPLKNTDPSGHCIFAIADTIACIVVAEALFDAAVVVVGGYLVYDSVNSLATTTAPDTVSSSIDDDSDSSTEPSASEEPAAEEQTPVNPPNSSGRAKNKLHPDPAAQGPHSTYKTDPKTGEVIGYETYEPNPRNPSGFDPTKRYDGQGEAHYNKKTGEDVQTPHVHERSTPGGVRPARPDEIPGRKGPF